MTEQLAVTLTVASIGFAAAVFFCIGNAFNSAKLITAQAIPYWDFSKPMARSLTAQRAQYVVGALLLVASFLLQIAAALSSSTILVALPQWLQSSPVFVLTVLVPTLLIARGFSKILYRTTLRKVLLLSKSK